MLSAYYISSRIDSNWHPNNYYFLNMIISALLPVAVAEITGRGITHLRAHTKKSQTNL